MKLIRSLPKRSAVSIDSTSRARLSSADREAILDHLDARAEPELFVLAIRPHDFAVQPDAQITLLLEEGEKFRRLGLGRDRDPESEQPAFARRSAR